LASIIVTAIAGIYIFFNGMMKGTMQVKIQILNNTGYSPSAELRTNKYNLLLRWLVFILVFFFIGWLEAIILMGVNLIGFYISFKRTKNKYIDPTTDSIRPDVFANEIAGNPHYKEM